MVRFEWDPVKASANRLKHGIDFDDAMQVFDDPFALFEQDRVDESGERRWRAIGLVAGVAVLLVAHTLQEEGKDKVVRLISARRATRKERNDYETTRA